MTTVGTGGPCSGQALQWAPGIWGGGGVDTGLPQSWAGGKSAWQGPGTGQDLAPPGSAPFLLGLQPRASQERASPSWPLLGHPHAPCPPGPWLSVWGTPSKVGLCQKRVWLSQKADSPLYPESPGPTRRVSSPGDRGMGSGRVKRVKMSERYSGSFEVLLGAQRVGLQPFCPSPFIPG